MATKEIKAGMCVCGRTVTMAARYAVNMAGPTTVKRVCPGYRCGRVNEIVIHASFELKPSTWKVRDCLCGRPLYLRGEYSGETQHRQGLDRLIDRDSHYKNRTATVKCRECGCKWTCRIRFEKTATSHNRTVQFLVVRCGACQLPAVDQMQGATG